MANPFVQTYRYDFLDRITEAIEKVNGVQTWKQTFGNDRYGNRTSFYQIVGTTVLPINNLTLPALNANNSNRFADSQGYMYDKNGNIINDPVNGNRIFTFNGDNKQVEVRDSGGVVIGKYFYDGNGRRVKKETNLETTVFIYNGMGNLIAEYSSAAPPPAPTINYTMTDQLGSPRVITNAAGQVVSRRDFMPFGEELYPDGTYRKTADKYQTTAQDAVRKRFTGYEKDIETGLDFAEARYYQNQHGRFTAVDPLLASGKSRNPQTFNRYVYVMNRPLMLNDPSGLQAGKWYKPIEADGIRTYMYASSAPDGYNEVTQRNRAGDLIGSGVGLDANRVLRFNPNGPYTLPSNFNSDVPNGSFFAPFLMSRYSYQGFDEIASDAYEDSSVEHPADGYARGSEFAFTPLDIALPSASIRFSVVGRNVGRSAASEITTVSTLEPGPFAVSSIPARGSGPLTTAERAEIDTIGRTFGCHTCGTTTPGTPNGRFIGDHQPPSRLAPATSIFPHCARCSTSQGGVVKGVVEGRFRNPYDGRN